MGKKDSKSNVLVAIVAIVVVGLMVIAASVGSVLIYRQYFEDGSDLVPALGRLDQQDNDNRQITDAGVSIIGVDPDSPAAIAGMRDGTIILKVNGVDVSTPSMLRAEINRYEAGDTITLTVQDGESTKEIEVTLESAGPYLGVEVAGGRFGSALAEDGETEDDGLPHPFEHFSLPDIPFEQLPPGHEEFFGEPFLRGQAVVFEVIAGTPAADAGLQVGDVILKFDDQPVTRRERLVELLQDYEPGDRVVLELQRGEGTLSLDLTLASHPDDPDRAYMGIRLFPVVVQPERFPDVQQG